MSCILQREKINVVYNNCKALYVAYRNADLWMIFDKLNDSNGIA